MLQGTSVSRASRVLGGNCPVRPINGVGQRACAIRVLIADRQVIFRQGLRTLLQADPDICVVGEVSDGLTAVTLASRFKPDVLLLEFVTPVLCFEVLRKLAKLSASVRTILLATAIDSEFLLEGVRLGLHGVLSRDSTPALLLKGIGAVMTGQYWLGRERVSDLVQRLRAPGLPSGLEAPQNHWGDQDELSLTTRELQIASAIVNGAKNREIAERLSLSENTVKHQLSKIFDKLGVSTRLEMAMFVTSHGILH